jgi:peptide/nickel transport system substrate-binding protein|tara:strand:+ start:514 stop:2400 length:1887 start_codon:yes stop_codon:yes gene_type:complete
MPVLTGWLYLMFAVAFAARGHVHAAADRRYAESPLIAERVAAGLLPPVSERLPRHPIVVSPLTRIGDYGGTARVFEYDRHIFVNTENPLTVDTDISTLLPNLARRWQWNADKSQLTLELRAGLRWSDGHPLTADDFLFYHYDLMRNEEYTPVPPPPWGETEVIRIDDLTIRYEFPEPYPLFENLLAQYGYYYVPRHFYERYHPSYVDRDELQAEISRMGYISWNNFLAASQGGSAMGGPYAPTMRTHYRTRRTPTMMTLERNPYYHKVDTQGRQLPYIDRIESEISSNVEVVTAKASTGQKDFAGYTLNTQDFPLFKLGEQTSGIRVLVWNRIHGSDVIIRPNYNSTDQRLRELYWDFRFRRALSVSLNREEMNQIIYFGRGTPRQFTVIPTSSYFEPEFAASYAEYDPATANRLLDDIGLVDIDGDGLREYSDGAPLIITIEFVEVETPRAITLELVTEYWRSIGIDARVRLLANSLHNQRSRAGTMAMSVWHGDRSTDLLFPAHPVWYVPIHINWEGSKWNDWVRWYQSEGRLGSRPPAEIVQLHTWWDEMRATASLERRIFLGKRILRSTADNLWSIGTVGLAPQPVVINARLKNVPEVGWWGWDTRWSLPYNPSSWFFEEGRAR